MTHLSRLTAALVAALLAMALAVPAMAQRPVDHNAAGVIAAVVHVEETLEEVNVLSDIGVIRVIEVSDSLNNVLQNARFLNNVTILQDFLNDLELLNDAECSVIAFCDALNDVNVNIDEVVAIDVLSGGDINLYVQG